MSLSANFPSIAKTREVHGLSPAFARILLIAAVAIGTVTALAFTRSDTTAAMDVSLVGLLRFMAVVKAVLALSLIGAVWWRLSSPIDGVRLAAYAVTAASMMSGLVLIWTMSHLGLGAALLHAGLLASCLLLRRDPAVSAKLSGLVAKRGL